MGNQNMTDFIIDSKDRCFFCLGKAGHDEFRSEPTTVQSLQYFSRFLRMDMKNVFSEKGDIPPHLLAKVEMSRLKAPLCQRCASINDKFSKLCQRLEKIKMEVLSSLENIYSELLKAEGSKEYQNLLKTPEDSEDEWEAKLGILEVVRKEAIKNCSSTIQRRGPRVRVPNMTNTDISKMKQNYKLNSTRQIKSDIGKAICQVKIERDETLTNLSFEDPEVDNEVDFEIERESPSSPTRWEEEAVVKNEHEKVTPGTKYRHVNSRWLSDPKITKNIDIIRVTGKPSAQKFRCRLCRKIFAKKYHAARHIKSIHLKEKGFQCPQCFDKFFRKEELKTHMDIHSGFKGYKCRVCLKDFRQKCNLRRHLTIHNRRRPKNKRGSQQLL